VTLKLNWILITVNVAVRKMLSMELACKQQSNKLSQRDVGNCKTDFVGAKCFQSVEYISWSYKRTSIDGTISSTDVPGIGQELLYMFLLGIFYQVLLIVLEYGWIKRLLGLVFRTGDLAFQTNTQDEDVLQEAQRVSGLVKSGEAFSNVFENFVFIVDRESPTSLFTGKVDEDALVVENFSKSYGSFAAVSNLSFGVHHGECFGMKNVITMKK